MARVTPEVQTNCRPSITLARLEARTFNAKKKKKGVILDESL